jgi:3-dehydroquinate dehydratase-1
LQKYLKKSKTDVLVSWHDFKKTPSMNELLHIQKDMTKFSKNVKIVTTAKSLVDSTKIMSLYDPESKINLIAFCMGEIGRHSRILCLYLGSPFTYVSLGKPIAPGQFSLDEVKSIFGKKKNR